MRVATDREPARATRVHEWRVLAAGAAVLAALVCLSVNDVEALAVAAGLVAAAGLLFVRRGLLGRLALVALSVNTVLWMAPAAWSNTSHGDETRAVAVPVTLVVLAVTAIVAVAASSRRVEAGARVTAVAALAAGAVVIAGASLAGTDAARARPGDLVLDARNTEFSPDELTVDAGPRGIVLTNKDLFWHTLTIDELDLDLRVPVRGTRRATVTLEPGTYEFVCAIPGHELAGMTGTLTVR